MQLFTHTYRYVCFIAILIICTVDVTTPASANPQPVRRPSAASAAKTIGRTTSTPDIVGVDSLASMPARVTTAGDTLGGDRSRFAVRNLQPAGITADPGTAQVILVKMSGRFSPTAEYSETVKAPAGWLRFSRATTFSVKTQSDLLRMIPVSIPKNAGAGTYTVVYAVRSLSVDTDRDSAVFSVCVTPREEYEIEITNTKPFAIGGTPIGLEVTVRNAGNTSAPVFLSLKSSKGYAISPECDSLRLAPRQHATVAVTVHTGDVEKKDTHLLEAAIVSSLSGTVVAAASVSADIIPRHGSAEIPSVYFPVAMKISALEDENGSAMQGEISGAGYLDEEKTHRLVFLARGPNTQNKIENGQRDEYRVLYQHDKFRIRGGDLTYSLSPLLQAGRYGMGGELSFAAGNFSVMSYYAYDRWSGDRHEQAGASAAARFSETVTGGVNLLQKNDGEKSTAASVQVSMLPFARHQLNAEYGVSRSHGELGSGHAIDFRGNFENTYYDVKKLSGDSKFTGYVKDQDLLAANLSHYFTNDLRVEFSGRKDNRNLNNDSTLSGGSSTFYQAGTGYGNLVSLYFRQQTDRIVYPGQSSNREQKSIQLRNGLQLDRWNFLTSVEYGLLTEEHRAEDFWQRRYGLQAGVQLSELSNLSINLDYAQQNQPGDSVRTDQVMGGFAAFLNFFKTVNLRVYGNMSRQFGIGDNISGTLESSLQYEIGSGHHIQLRARYISSPNQRNHRISAALEYSLPLSMPLARIDNIGILSGTLKDEHGSPIENVIISSGELVTVTDRDGRFIFSAVPPGENYIMIDRSTIGVGRITLQDNPLRVNVPKGEETTIAITAVPAGRISGIVDLFGYQNTGYIDSTQKKLQRIGGLEGIFVELKNNREVYRKFTDVRGSFSFSDLKPGEYTLSVGNDDLPEHHQLEKNNISLSVTAGESKDAVFKVIPIIRTIKIIKKGILE